MNTSEHSISDRNLSALKPERSQSRLEGDRRTRYRRGASPLAAVTITAASPEGCAEGHCLSWRGEPSKRVRKEGQSRGTPDKASGTDPRASQGELLIDILWEERKMIQKELLRLEKQQMLRKFKQAFTVFFKNDLNTNLRF